MKKILFILAFFIIFPFVNVKASADLDYILKYDISVEPLKDGTLNLEYYIEWEVLDSSSDGPLEWVKIGIPNHYISNLKNLDGGTSIKDISLYTHGGSYIRIDFSYPHYQGDIVKMHFSFNQSHMYTLDDEYTSYCFNPGWFNEIEIEVLNVKWKRTEDLKEAYFTNCDSYDNDYYYWQEKYLVHNRTIDVSMKYEKKLFDELDPAKSYVFEKPKDDSFDMAILVIAAIVVIIIISIVLGIIQKRAYGDGYYYYRGFSLDYYHRYSFFRRPGVINSRGNARNVVVIPRSGSGGGGHSCACACACACAGGGRAGCSRKDFYHPNVSVDDIIKNKHEN